MSKKKTDMPQKKAIISMKEGAIIFRRLLSYFKPYKLRLIIILLGILLSVGGSVAATMMLSIVVDSYCILYIQ